MIPRATISGAVIPGAALLLSLACGIGVADDVSRPETTGLPPGIMAVDGRRAPGLVLTDMDGGSFDLNSLRGEWVLVHFWASWCGPCRKEMPTFQGLSEQLTDSSMNIVLVNTAETDDQVFEFLSIAAPDLATLMDYEGDVTAQWQPRGLPASFVVDPAGRIRYLALGGRAWNTPPYVHFLLRVSANKPAAASQPVQ